MAGVARRSGTERLEEWVESDRAVARMKADKIRRRHPRYDGRQVMLAAVQMRYGDELTRAAWPNDPFSTRDRPRRRLRRGDRVVFVAALYRADVYLPINTARDALAHGGSFNVLHTGSAGKVDVFIVFIVVATTSSSARNSIDSCKPTCSGSRRGWQRHGPAATRGCRIAGITGDLTSGSSEESTDDPRFLAAVALDSCIIFVIVLMTWLALGVIVVGLLNVAKVLVRLFVRQGSGAASTERQMLVSVDGSESAGQSFGSAPHRRPRTPVLSPPQAAQHSAWN